MTSRQSRPMGVVQSRLFLRFFVHTQKEGPFFLVLFLRLCALFFTPIFSQYYFSPTKSQRQKKKKKKPKKKEEEEEVVPSFAVFEKALVFENNLSFRPFFSSFLKHSSTLNIAWVGLRSLITRTPLRSFTVSI